MIQEIISNPITAIIVVAIAVLLYKIVKVSIKIVGFIMALYAAFFIVTNFILV